MNADADIPREIIEFFRKLDRSYFIEGEYKKAASYDQALPIGFGQTISQPSLVLEMTLALELNRNCRVLEIGTGSGFQTAILAAFAAEVFTVERILDLSEAARKRLVNLNYTNIRFKIGDGTGGWEEHAPYDRILAAAAASRVPQPLIKQLKPGGRMVLPVGEKGLQELLLVKKMPDGSVTQEFLGEVRFVELKGDYGWSRPEKGV